MMVPMKATTQRTYWHKFQEVVNRSKSRHAAAKALKVSASYVSWNASRLRRAGWDIKRFPVGAKLKGVK